MSTTYNLTASLMFSGFSTLGNQLWDVQAILPTGYQDFVVEIPTNTELAIHQAICNRINNTIVTIGQAPVWVGGETPPPPSFVNLAWTPPGLDINNIWQSNIVLIDATVTDSVNVVTS